MKLLYTIFTLIIFSCSNNDDKKNETPSQAATIQHAGEKEFTQLPGIFTAEQISKAYDENSVKADADFKTKIITVAGTISNITTRNETAVIELRGNNDFNTVDCEMFDAKEALTFKKGDKVKLVGMCMGIELTDPVIGACKIVQ